MIEEKSGISWVQWAKDIGTLAEVVQHIADNASFAHIRFPKHQEAIDRLITIRNNLENNQ